MKAPYLLFILSYYLLRASSAWIAGDRYFIAFLNVGQGDAIVINIPQMGKILIDTGPDYQANYLSAKYDKIPFCTIKAAFVTHYDSDHSGGMQRILRYCPNMTIYDNVSAGDVLKFKDVSLQILNPQTVSKRTGNNESLVIKVERGSFSALLTGDAGLDVLNKLQNGGIDVYKVSHHGSEFNTSFELLNRFKPRICVVSVGKNNYGHPSGKVLSYINSSKCRLYRTDVDGTVMVYF